MGSPLHPHTKQPKPSPVTTFSSFFFNHKHVPAAEFGTFAVTPLGFVTLSMLSNTYIYLYTYARKLRG